MNGKGIGADVADDVPKGRSIWIPTAVLLGVFWLLIFNQQRLEWTVNAVYSYGWAVPFLALFLFYERWRRRPAEQNPPAQPAPAQPAPAPGEAAPASPAPAPK